MLAKSFAEARRVLKAEGHLVVVFGHSDPDAWRRLLGALHTAGFVVTAAWPSRTESANTGVASIKVTVTIGCRVAPKQCRLGVSAQVDREVTDAVTERARQWDADGFALEDQLMASYGPAMEVYGRYSRVINPDGSEADLDRYLNIARRAVRDAMRLRVDELPLETFDAVTRFAVFWLRAKGRAEVPKGEARFFAQADELRLDDLRGSILTESAGGFRLRLDDPGEVSPQSSTFEVVRAMVHAWATGGTEPVAAVMSIAERDSSDQQLWAVISDLARQIPSADSLAKALAGIKRVSNTVSTLLDGSRRETVQLRMFDERGGAR
jgi:adenine-specific DNA methylase